MSDSFDPTEWITTKEAAELTGYSPIHFRQLAQRGKIEGLKKGRDWLLRKKAVITYVEEMKRLGKAKHDPWRTGARRRSSKEGSWDT